jgi:DNA-binding NarL/FixJ family response regulator
MFRDDGSEVTGGTDPAAGDGLPAGEPGIALPGRGPELAVLTPMLERAAAGHGSAVLLRGEAGTGKTALLTAAQRIAAARDIQVLAGSGVRAETHLPFAGLNQLLRPVPLAELGLPDEQADLLRAALGLDKTMVADLYRVALAVLELLATVAAKVPLLVVADDAHRLDRPSADVLAFVGRRVAAEPIAIMLAARDSAADPFLASGIASLRLTAQAGEHQAPLRGDLPQLTPQELQIARLAASGLSNKQIGEQLFLSHRTVGSHLYHLFPKLGITARAQLPHALKSAGHDLV